MTDTTKISFKSTIPKTKKITAKAVIVATGGVSYPKTGSPGDGYKFAKKFGHKIVKLRPALAPIILKNDVRSL